AGAAAGEDNCIEALVYSADVRDGQGIPSRAEQVCSIELPLVSQSAGISRHHKKRCQFPRLDDLVLRLCENLDGRTYSRELRFKISTGIEGELKFRALGGRRNKNAECDCDGEGFSAR